MKRTKDALFALILTAGCSTGQASQTAQSAPDQAHDDASIEALMHELDAAWNAHDADAALALYADDATIVTPVGKRVEGRAQLRALLASPGPTKQTQSTVQLDAVQWIADDLAIVDATQTLKGPGVEVIGTSEATLVAVVQRIDGRWRFVAARPHVKPASP